MIIWMMGARIAVWVQNSPKYLEVEVMSPIIKLPADIEYNINKSMIELKKFIEAIMVSLK